jgi:hypothetical protein
MATRKTLARKATPAKSAKRPQPGKIAKKKGGPLRSKKPGKNQVALPKTLLRPKVSVAAAREAASPLAAVVVERARPSADFEQKRKGAAAEALKTALSGPSADAIIRRQALLSFIVLSMSGAPNSPQPGQPAWGNRMVTLNQVFEDRLTPFVPVDPGTMDAELSRFHDSAAGLFATRPRIKSATAAFAAGPQV